jgi:multidrug resistance efflux pump
LDAGPDIKSPVRGTVKRLRVNTVGGVVQLGKEVAEIVPLDDALTVAGGRVHGQRSHSALRAHEM